jgi:hypothetical protein
LVEALQPATTRFVTIVTAAVTGGPLTPVTGIQVGRFRIIFDREGHDVSPDAGRKTEMGREMRRSEGYLPEWSGREESGLG